MANKTPTAEAPKQAPDGLSPSASGIKVESNDIVVTDNTEAPAQEADEFIPKEVLTSELPARSEGLKPTILTELR